MGDREAAAIRRVRALARLLDDSIPIPGTSRRIGIDPILGLVPVAGDVAGYALSAWIVFEAYRLGVPSAALTRMLVNVAVETAVGAVPILGDLVDAGWKANLRNVALLERSLGLSGPLDEAPAAEVDAAPVAAERASRLAVVLGVLLFLPVVLALSFFTTTALLRQLGVW